MRWRSEPPRRTDTAAERDGEIKNERRSTGESPILITVLDFFLNFFYGRRHRRGAALSTVSFANSFLS